MWCRHSNHSRKIDVKKNEKNDTRGHAHTICWRQKIVGSKRITDPWW